MLQPLAIAVVALLALELIDGTRWLVVFPPLIILFLVWFGQALDAYQRAIRAGARRGGELAICLLLPLMLTVLTAFWLVGGRHGSPSATLQSYIEAWIADRPDAGARLFATPLAPDSMASLWKAERGATVERITRARAVHGAGGGLDPERPFQSLRFREAEASEGRVAMVAEIVRSRRVETTLLGFIPTASQETVVVERDVTIWLTLERQPPPEWLPFLQLDSYAWKIDSIEEPPGS